jgi:hypothetical protein
MCNATPKVRFIGVPVIVLFKTPWKIHDLASVIIALLNSSLPLVPVNKTTFTFCLSRAP